MPTYQRFEDLPVWQTAAELYDQVDTFIDAAPPRLRHSFRDQFERGTTSELLAFLYIARGSAAEVRSMLTLLGRHLWVGTGLKSQISKLKSLAESCFRQLRAWADSLQNSEIAGQRHLNDASRSNYDKRAARKTGEANFKKLLAEHGSPARGLRARPAGDLKSEI